MFRVSTSYCFPFYKKITIFEINDKYLCNVLFEEFLWKGGFFNFFISFRLSIRLTELWGDKSSSRDTSHTGVAPDVVPSQRDSDWNGLEEPKPEALSSGQRPALEERSQYRCQHSIS